MLIAVVFFVSVAFADSLKGDTSAVADQDSIGVEVSSVDSTTAATQELVEEITRQTEVIEQAQVQQEADTDSVAALVKAIKAKIAKKKAGGNEPR